MMRRRILVIDDMEFNRHHLKKVLEADDLDVDTAEDGRSAWDRLKAQRYHLVVTDLRMPDVGGQELLAQDSPRETAAGRDRPDGVRRSRRGAASDEGRRRRFRLEAV